MSGDIWGYSAGKKCRKPVHCLQTLFQLKKWTANSQNGKLIGNLNVVIHPMCGNLCPLKKMICNNFKNDFST